jgi:hypothetical protein
MRSGYGAHARMSMRIWNPGLALLPRSLFPIPLVPQTQDPRPQTRNPRPDTRDQPLILEPHSIAAFSAHVKSNKAYQTGKQAGKPSTVRQGAAPVSRQATNQTDASNWLATPRAETSILGTIGPEAYTTDCKILLDELKDKMVMFVHG